jgi:hypothetical protein
MSATDTVPTSKQARTWRDLLQVHPAPEKFPLMSLDEQRELGEDIRKSGLTAPIVIWGDLLVDGRNRLDAMELVGVPFKLTKEAYGWNLKVGTQEDCADRMLVTDDPVAFVISANVHRRHLTPEKKREVIAELLKADPTKSNRRIAETVNVDDKTVAAVRRELESGAEIPHLTKIVGKDGKTQTRKQQSPGTKPKVAAAPSAKETKPYTPADIADRAQQRSELAAAQAAARSDFGPACAGEIERLQALVNQLEAENNRLKRENAALVRRVEKLDRALGAAQVVNDIEGVRSDAAAIKTSPPDDGLDIPDYLRRAAP